MKNFKYLATLLIVAIIINGCSSKYEVTFDSNPKGATLICNGTNWGYTPKKLYYDEKVKDYSYIDLSSCSANWVSGYSANYSQYVTIYPSGGTITTVNRPNNDEGYYTDAQFALQVQMLNAQQAQAAAARAAANAQKRQADQQFYDSLKPKTYNVTPNYMGGYNIIQY